MGNEHQGGATTAAGKIDPANGKLGVMVVGLGAVAGLRPIRPKRMRTRVGMLRRPAKT